MIFVTKDVSKIVFKADMNVISRISIETLKDNQSSIAMANNPAGQTHSPQNLPANCVCGKSNSIEHAFSCSNGAFPTIRHNDNRYLTADLLTEVCHDVSTEPSLQPLTGESLSLRTVNCGAGDRLDIKLLGLSVSTYFFQC